MSRAARDARVLLEALVVIVLTWVLLGWWFGEPLVRGDGPRLFAPYLREALEAGPSATDYAYRFGVIGGSAMEPAVGMSPLVLVCSAVGLSTTTVMNLIAVFDQLCFAFFAIVMIEALVTLWSGSERRLTVLERALAILWCAFAPLLGWRLAAGHVNLLEGLLPFVAAVSLWWSARARTLSLTTLVVAWLAVFHALPSMGQQTMVYSAVFGAPLLIVTLVGGGRAHRFVREHICVILTLAAGVLCAAPIVLEMVRFHVGEDASRQVTGSMFYAYGDPHLRDWLTSVPWTTAASYQWPGTIAAHETNYPLGPIALFAVALWSRSTPRDVGLALLIGALLAITFSLDLDPIASLLRHLPVVDAFRVPARAILPVLVVVPTVVLALVLHRIGEPLAPARPWLFGAVAVVGIAVASFVPSLVREVVSWLACVAVCVVLRRGEQRHRAAIPWLLILVAVLGVASFDERYDTAPAAQRIEDEPRVLRDRLLAQAPELAMPLTRVQVPDRPLPFSKSTAFAAGLPTLDGVGFPPRRFLRLLSALWNEPVSTAEADFDLTHRDRFDILAQLYNVKYVVPQGEPLTSLPPTNGPAWFTRDVGVMQDPREMIRVLRTRGVDVRAVLSRVAWVMRDELPDELPADPACADARVMGVRTDPLGQTATIDVASVSGCVLVVATNYTSLLRATASGRSLRLFPVDIALTGIVVPAGATSVALTAIVDPHWWWTLLGCLVMAGSLALWLFKVRAGR